MLATGLVLYALRALNRVQRSGLAVYIGRRNWVMVVIYSGWLR